MLSNQNTFFTAGLEWEYKLIGTSNDCYDVHRELQNMGFDWTSTGPDGSAAPDAETIFAPMPVNENGIMSCALADIARLLEALESLGADCPVRVTGLGMHCHIGNRLVTMDPAEYWEASKRAFAEGSGNRRYFRPDTNDMTDVMSLALVKDVVQRYADHQGDIDAILAPSRREGRSEARYCHSIRPVGFHGHYRDQFEAATNINRMSAILGSLGQCEKYSAINLEHWSTKNTIEFRQHQGTLELAKMNKWVGLLVTMFQHSDRTRLRYPTLETVSTPEMPHRPTTKIGVAWALCRRAGGAHVQEIMAATGWDATTVRARVSEWRSAHDERAVITHTQQSYGARYGSTNGAYDQCGFEIPETYQRGEAGDVELLPANRAGVTSIWGSVADDAFEYFAARRQALSR